MYSYSDLISVNQLNPSWPQVQRLVVCGQLLILAHDAGELHRREAQTLFQLLHDLLLKHQDTWPICAELIIGFKAVTRVFGECPRGLADGRPQSRARALRALPPCRWGGCRSPGRRMAIRVRL